MNETEVLAYVKAAAAALDLPLDDSQCARVATHLARTAALARQLEAFELDVADEPAQVYEPLAFQPADGEGSVP